MRNNAYSFFTHSWRNNLLLISGKTYVILSKMSWYKDSASVGLGGLTVREAAKGALLCEEFQKMPYPLFKVLYKISFH